MKLISWNKVSIVEKYVGINLKAGHIFASNNICMTDFRVLITLV